MADSKTSKILTKQNAQSSITNCPKHSQRVRIVKDPPIPGSVKDSCYKNAVSTTKSENNQPVLVPVEK